ncbi:MAG: RagB/SusD family nutrient uptake outer membrane protein [Saprospiraceae bacterium]|nr:RagB/SusD family nutrient uptake outer membrane protein [Saprospiraceae bacterium]
MKIIKYFFIFSCLTAIFSCKKDLLDTAPKGVLAEGVLSASSVDKLVVAAYQSLGGHFFGNDESFAGPSSNWIIDVRSDDAYKGGGGITDRTDIHQLETATMDATNYACFQKWRNPYFGIARCNLAIREIEKLDDAKYPKAARIAEMRLLRGHFHFDLKRNYNQIAYLGENDDPTAVGNTDLNSDEVWQKIKEDFQFAYDNLPIEQEEIGRVNKYAAAGYLAKLAVELKQWDEVIAQTNFVMSGPFALLPDFQNLGTIEFENGPESVFTIQFSTASIFANHSWGDLLNVTLGPGIDGGAYANGDDFYLGSQNLVNAFRTGNDGLPLFDNFNNTDVLSGGYSGPLDPRVDFTFGRIGIPWKGNTANYELSWVRSTDYLPGFSCKKHVVAPNDPNVHNSFPWAASGLNFCIIRYAEVLLWQAEALIEKNQDLDKARQLINDVRNRAKGSPYVQKLDGSGNAANYKIEPYPSTNWTQDYARKAVRFERRLELAMEGHRFYDLVRWGVAAQAMNDYYSSEAAKVEYLEGINFQAGKHEYLPIPQHEIDLAPLLYFQNPNY